MSGDNNYEEYITEEWRLFVEDPRRAVNSLEAVNCREIRRVLDVGCGAGQELLPFVSNKNAFGVGVDIAPDVGMKGMALFQTRVPHARVSFARSVAEDLPFAANTFDLVICRLALPYTDNRRALQEVARVLRPGGAFLLKIHHPRYYLRKLRNALSSADLLSTLHSARVLGTGVFYLITGSQPRNRLTAGGETFQTASMLEKELKPLNLRVSHELADSNNLTPSFLIIKESKEE